MKRIIDRKVKFIYLFVEHERFDKIVEDEINSHGNKNVLFCQLNWQVAGDPELLPCLTS